MFTHMALVKKVSYDARRASYELLVYRVQEDGAYQIYISKDGFGVGDVFTASESMVTDGDNVAGPDIVETLIEAAKNDIRRNEFGLY